MWLLVGLGNPGKGYERNRHNAGFMAAEAIASAHKFSPFVRKFSGLISEGNIGGEKALVLKPETFMNLSGESVQAAAQFYKIPLDHIIVLHDDLDIASAKIRVKTGGASGGHNGLKDIDARLGKEYIRVRLGIGHPGPGRDASPYVLGNFGKEEQVEIDILAQHIADNIGYLLRGDAPGFMTKVALLMNPPPPKVEKPIKKKEE